MDNRGEEWSTLEWIEEERDVKEESGIPAE